MVGTVFPSLPVTQLTKGIGMGNASLPQLRLFWDFSVSTSNFALGDDASEFEVGMDENG
jgi:hypothetical protein